MIFKINNEAVKFTFHTFGNYDNCLMEYYDTCVPVGMFVDAIFTNGSKHKRVTISDGTIVINNSIKSSTSGSMKSLITASIVFNKILIRSQLNNTNDVLKKESYNFLIYNYISLLSSSTNL